MVYSFVQFGVDSPETLSRVISSKEEQIERRGQKRLSGWYWHYVMSLLNMHLQ